MARSTNEDIISLCDRITAFCNRINKKLDEYGEFPSSFHEPPVPQPPYGHPPLVEAGYHPPHAQPPDPPDWQRLHRPYDWATHVAHQPDRYPPPPPYQPETPSDLPATFVDCHTTALLQHQSPNFCAQPQPAYLHPDHGMPRQQICWDPPDQRQALAATPTRYTIAGYQDLLPEYHKPSQGPNQCGHTSPQTRQSTSWDLPSQPIQHGILPYDWQPPPDQPLPPPPTNEPDPSRQPHLAPLEQLNYLGRSYYVQEQGSAVEYHQQLPPQPVLDQPHPQQRSSSGWSLTSHCRSAAPLPADVIPPSNLQHVSSASETVTNRLPNQAPVSAISTPMLSSCFLSFAPVSVRAEAGTTSITNKSVVFGQAVVPEQTMSQSEPSIACAPQSLQKAHKDVEVVKMLSRTMAGDFDFTITNEKFKKDHVLSTTGESIRLQFKSTKGHGEALDHQSSTLDADARLIPPGMDMPYLGICGREDKIHVLALNYHNSKDLPLVSFDVAAEGRRSTSQCVFDPGGDSSLMLLFATLLDVSWFPP